MLPQGIEGSAGKVGSGKPDGGQRGQREFGEVDIVEADDREVLRDTQALEVSRAEDADGGHVVGADDCRGLS